MAKKRMFSLEVIDTDEFLNMPLSTQALYFHLSMRADDDGFVSSPKKIMNMTGCRQDDMNVLLTKQYIIPFDTGICVIRHWKINNYIRNDRYSETIYTSEKAQLSQNDNGTYSVGIPNGIPLVDTDKSSIEKNSIVESSNKPTKHKHGEYQHVLLTDEELNKLKARFSDWQAKIQNLDTGIELKGYKYKNHYLAILKWSEKDKPSDGRLKNLSLKYPRYSDIPESERQGITLEQWNNYRKG